MMGIANFFYNIGEFSEEIMKPKNVDGFRKLIFFNHVDVRKFFIRGGLFHMAFGRTIHLFNVGMGNFIESDMTAFAP